MNAQVLLTGDYWHADFQDIVKAFDSPLTLIPLSQLRELETTEFHFDLVVIAQSRRGQISSDDADALLEKFPNTPLIGLLGSWCEGETRSGEPIPGMIRVFWHQWSGRYQNFRIQLAEHRIADWHQPRTASLADRALKKPQRVFPRSLGHVGVSAWSKESFEMLADGLDAVGFQSSWLDHDEARKATGVDALLIDGNSLTPAVVQRIESLRARFEETPIVLALNFPRKDEFETARRLGASGIVSKPFELADLGFAMERALRSVVS